MTTQEQARLRAAWDAIAAGSDRTNTPSRMGLGNDGLRRAGLRRGMRFLDVAAGSGELSIPAARLGARVLATDLSSPMLERLERRAREEGLGVETRVMDGHALELDDDSFDMAGSQFGVMLFPDMPRGISELARITKPGGRVLMIAYGDPHEIEVLRLLRGRRPICRPVVRRSADGSASAALPARRPGTATPGARDRGLRDIRVETIIETTEFHSGEHFWDWLVHSNPIVGGVLGDLNLPDDQIGVVQKTLDRMVRERSGGAGPARLTNPV